jgi:hypothetical protein
VTSCVVKRRSVLPTWIMDGSRVLQEDHHVGERQSSVKNS